MTRTKICVVCGKDMEEKVGNISFERSGVEIFLVGARHFACECVNRVVLPSDVREEVERLLEEKKDFPDSPPVLTIDLSQKRRRIR